MTLADILDANDKVDKPIDAVNNKTVSLGESPFKLNSDPIRKLTAPLPYPEEAQTMESILGGKEEADFSGLTALPGSEQSFGPLKATLGPNIDSIARLGLGGEAEVGYDETQIREVLRKVLRMI